MLPGCHVAEAAGAAAAVAAPTTAFGEPPTLIALAVGCAAPTVVRAANLATGRDTAADGREPDSPTGDTGA